MTADDRISAHFNLGRSQSSLDFVDVDTSRDLAVFVDPSAIRSLRSEWGRTAVQALQSFFSTVLASIHDGDEGHTRSLFANLQEPNETHLGLSIGSSRGRGLGRKASSSVWNAISKSEAAKTGMLSDLEDTLLLVPGVGPDLISDATTNIIRGLLIEYTQKTCDSLGIRMEDKVYSGPMWSSESSEWEDGYVALPTINQRKILFVPKYIVRRRLEYDVDEYYRDYIVPHLQHEELNANSGLVQLLKNKKRRVTKKSIKEKYGGGKKMIAFETMRNPSILDDYRLHKQSREIELPMHSQVSEMALGYRSTPDWNELLECVVRIEPGQKQATDYENAIQDLLSVVLYPALVFPEAQTRLHGGRKRVDITYNNEDHYGFFKWVGSHYKAAKIFVECKNYSADVENPELDQLSGRFSGGRGQVGILVCRRFENKDLFLRRCRDTANDGRGYILTIDDEDLSKLIEEKKGDERSTMFSLLRSRFDKLIL